MGLLKNYQALNDTPGRWLSGGATGQGLTRATWNTSGAARNRFYSEAGYSALSAWPAGYTPTSGGAFVVAQKSGGMAASLRIFGAGAAAGAGALGLNANAPLSGSGGVSNAQGALVLFAVAQLVGAATLSGAIEALGNIASGLTGAGDLDGTGELLEILEAAASLSGSGALTGDLGAKAGAAAILSGVGAIVSAARANGSLASAIVVTGDVLSTANIASAVWDTQTEVDGLTQNQAMRVMLSVLSGKCTVVESPPGTFTVTFRSIDDTADRLVSVGDAEGNRDSTTATP